MISIYIYIQYTTQIVRVNKKRTSLTAKAPLWSSKSEREAKEGQIEFKITDPRIKRHLKIKEPRINKLEGKNGFQSQPALHQGAEKEQSIFIIVKGTRIGSKKVGKGKLFKLLRKPNS